MGVIDKKYHKESILHIIKTLHEEGKAVRIENGKGYNYVYRRLTAVDYDGSIMIYDNSYDIYRPLSDYELVFMGTTSNFDKMIDRIVIKASKQRINSNRVSMQIAIASKNDKLKNYHYKIAVDEINFLRNFLGINRN